MPLSEANNPPPQHFYVSNSKNTLNLKYRHLPSYLTVPEGVSYSVSETDEALLVFSHKVTCVEVGVTLHEHVPHELLLGQLLASSIAKEGAEGTNFGQ